MLDDLRLLFKQPVRHRTRVYLRAVAALALGMTVVHFDPVEQASSGAPLWIALAVGTLAVAGRTMAVSAAVPPSKKTPIAQPGRYLTPHERDLATRNLLKPAQP